MKLQNIIFPSINNCIEEKLYFRGEEKLYFSCKEMEEVKCEFNLEDKVDFDLESGVLRFTEEEEVFFDTYFNGFSVNKWLKYTRIDNVTLRLRLKGNFAISLIYKEEMAVDQIMTQVVHTLKVNTKGEIDEISIPLDCSKTLGMYSFSCKALSEGCELYGGEWCSDIEQIEEVKIAAIICTFRREQYIEKNMKILEESFFKNSDSDLKDKLTIYISDNGNSLNAEAFDSESIRIFPNKNAGGAGGFTRGLIEAWKAKEDSKITHVLLMDDDVVIQPESIYRTYAIWSLIKDEYRESFIGGGVLNLDRPWIQIESGAYWNAGKVQSRKGGLNLRETQSCLRNEVYEHTDYQGWWYCSFSLNHVREDNLPLPLFIKVDDVEYGIRNMKHLILLNGICVWHEPFEYKNLSSFYYYWYRNWLITNAVCGKIDSHAKKVFWRELQARVVQEIFTLRYKNAGLLLEAVEDFLKGIDWLKEQDPENLNQRVMESGYKLSPLEELEVPFSHSQYIETRLSVEGKTHRYWRKITLNGIFTRKGGDAIVPTVNPHIYYLHQKGRALHCDYSTKKGFVTIKDNKELIRLIKKLFYVKRQLDGQYRKASEEYNLRGKELMQLGFWEKYLEL